MKIRISEDLEECRRLWSENRPGCFFDLWWVRAAFADAFARPLHMIIAEENGKVSGFLPLCRIEESRCFGYFPGETWKGRTWLEQNRLRTSRPGVVHQLLDAAPESTHLRYLSPEPWHAADRRIVEDEVGYLFLPGRYGYDFQAYCHQFSGKTWKKMAKEMQRVSSPGLSFRYDHLQDVAKMFQMNMETFGSDSYFSDASFLAAFETMMRRLHENEMLRITTVLIGGKIAAIDVGAVWKNTYTVLAGSTSPDFPGVAKLINFHHLEWACRERIHSVDFLCGDFGWKKRFHLSPRLLYEIKLPGNQAGESDTSDKARAYA